MGLLYMGGEHRGGSPGLFGGTGGALFLVCPGAPSVGGSGCISYCYLLYNFVIYVPVLMMSKQED